MTIISSIIVSDVVQTGTDGRRSVLERHTTDTGEVIDVPYMAEPGTDAQATANARAAQMEADSQ